MSFILQFTSNFNERSFFVASGSVHTSKALGTIRLISATTPHQDHAKKFDTAPEAAQVLVDAGNPAGWDIIPI